MLTISQNYLIFGFSGIRLPSRKIVQSMTMQIDKKRITNIFLMPLIALILGACSGPTINQTYTSSGMTAYQITCGGIFGGADTSSCYLAAGNICGTKGYTTAHTGPSSIIASCREGENSSAITSPSLESGTPFTSKQ